MATPVNKPPNEPLPDPPAVFPVPLVEPQRPQNLAQFFLAQLTYGSTQESCVYSAQFERTSAHAPVFPPDIPLPAEPEPAPPIVTLHKLQKTGQLSLAHPRYFPEQDRVP